MQLCRLAQQADMESRPDGRGELVHHVVGHLGASGQAVVLESFGKTPVHHMGGHPGAPGQALELESGQEPVYNMEGSGCGCTSRSCHVVIDTCPHRVLYCSTGGGITK